MTESLTGRGGRRLAMFPLSTVLFPHVQMPLHVFEPRYRALVADCLAGDPRFGVVLIARGSEVGGGDQRTALGTRAVITHAASLADGRSLMLVRGDVRLRVTAWLPDDPYPMALVEEWGPEVEPVDEALLRRAIESVRHTRGLLSETGSGAALSPDVQFDDDPEVACWQICAEAHLSTLDAQGVLSAEGSTARLELLIEHSEALAQDLRRMLAQS
ncbi:MAG: LON peptidase substrate-binding domain-containing protein [Acidimicrobiales bacterium]